MNVERNPGARSLLLATIGLILIGSSVAHAVSPALNVGSASGVPGATVQIAIQIVRNSNDVTATSNLISYDNTKFTPGTCVAQSPFSLSAPNGNALLPFNGRICSNNPPAVSCTTDSDCGVGNSCNVNSVGSVSLADKEPDTVADPFVADGTFLLCPFTITAGTAAGTYPLTNVASFSTAAADEMAATGSNGSITVLLDTDGDLIPDTTDNCKYTSNPDQLDRGGLGTGSPADGIGDACQCGDVTGDGRVTNADSVVILRSGFTPPTATKTNPQLCDVGPTGPTVSCTQADSVIVLRGLFSPPTATILQHCAPANP